MSKIDDIRAELLGRQQHAVEAYQRAKLILADAESSIDVARTAIAAHDRAVEAMREDAGSPAPNGHDAPSRQRRNLEAATLDRLTTEPQSLDALVEKIGNVKPGQIEAALKRLVEAGKAAPHLAGAGLIGGYVRVESAPE
jgi:hypothetical protein